MYELESGEISGENLPVLVQMVVNGKKPSAWLTRKEMGLQDPKEVCEQYNLVCAQVQGLPPTRSSIAFSRNETVGSLVDRIELRPVPRCASGFYPLLERLKNLPIAQALVELTKSYDDRGRGSEECEFMEGLLLGFKPCCVAYYVEGPFNERDHALQDKLNELNLPNSHIRCSDCAKKILSGQ